MMKNLGRTAIAAALAFATFAASTTAEARDRHRDRGGDDAAIAIGAGIIGLAVGAAIASDGDRGRRYRDDYYYDEPRYPRYRGYHYDNAYPRHHRKNWRKHERRWHNDHGYHGDRRWRGERRWREERRYRDHRW